MPKKLSNALTPFAVKNARPGRHADGGGLHLLVKESGARSWVYRYMINGTARGHGFTLTECQRAYSAITGLAFGWSGVPEVIPGR